MVGSGLVWAGLDSTRPSRNLAPFTVPAAKQHEAHGGDEEEEEEGEEGGDEEKRNISQIQIHIEKSINLNVIS